MNMTGYRFLVSLFIWLSSYVVPVFALPSPQVIDVTRFGAIPDDRKDDSRALRKAAQYCREHAGVTFFFPPGTYLLRDKEAVRLETEVMAGKMGENPEQVIFTPDYPYVKGLDLTGAKDVTLSGRGAVLMCDGWMEPISITDCENVTVIGLTIDYVRKPFATGRVTAVEDAYFDVQFLDDRLITNETPLMRMTFWDEGADAMHPEPIYFPKREILGGNRVRFHHAIPRALSGSVAGVGHSFHFRPGILILRSTNTSVINVTIHSQPGMGIVGFDSKDIFLKQLAVVPAPGYYFSTNTDATHFACCEGILHFSGCRFRGQGDDATNVHGYYQTLLSADGCKTRLRVKAPTYTHAQVPDVPRIGDEMELVDRRTLCPVRTYKVEQVDWHEGSLEPMVTLDGELPQEYSSFFLFNVTKLPKLIFENSLVDSHHARGVLIKTRDVLVQNNVFRRGTGTAIHVGTEGGWHEGTHSKKVVIKDNMIIGCGKGAGSQQGACGIAVNAYADDTEATYLHDDIRITGNMILGAGNACGIYVGNAKNVTVSDNKIRGCAHDVVFHSVTRINQEN